MSEKPDGTSAPSSSTVDAGIVATGVLVAVAVAVAVRCGKAVSVGADSVADEGEGGVTEPGVVWQAASVITINMKNLLNTFPLVQSEYDWIILTLRTYRFPRSFHRSRG
jgi:hypothetical protein